MTRGASVFRKITLACIGVLAFASMSMAKDGPFPMLTSVGIWESKGVRGILVDIRAGTVQGRSVDVSVYIRAKNDGHIVASGATSHDLQNHELRVVVTDSQGEQSLVVLTAVYKDGCNGSACEYELNMAVRRYSKFDDVDDFSLIRQ